MNEIVVKRIAALQQKLKVHELDAAVIMDRENLIYFANSEDIEGGSLIVPAQGEPKLICLWLDARHMRDQSGLEVVPYFFPNENVSQKTADMVLNLGITNPRIGFTRYFINLKDFQCLRATVPGIYFGDIAEVCYRLRSIKSEQEIEYISKAAEFVAVGMKAAMESVRPGMKETDILAEGEYAMRKAGSEGSTFRMQVLRHDRQQLIHPYAGDYVIENNQPVVIHLGASYKGYAAKMCRTVFLGEVARETIDIYKLLMEAQKVAIEALKPGSVSSEIFDKVFKVVHDHGYAKMFMEQIGYGVGIRQSEFYPVIGKGIDHVIQENMVVDLLLPTIYEPKFGGPRITDTVLVRGTGNVVLTNLPKEPVQ
ncbi:aminopeptidase P family protein [Desulfosporosinus fructosivorans]|uniref:Aminopeptidase P family protein n=1 Tax=Desulfosporosinus fructosivorans TaxID=2018669 RepID=A0A4Z0QXV7_9FIRM|nr:Xaa-Pro peptidase family protein [Desulfosporosinus fructosivorans]TGE34803.1 aminopeptidase P family protein [Desulfosporosinus fructosivorans]